MAIEATELEGTWEELLAHHPELRGKRVRVTILAHDAVEDHPSERRSTGADLLKHAGTWVGDDLKELREEVKRMRGKARF